MSVHGCLRDPRARGSPKPRFGRAAAALLVALGLAGLIVSQASGIPYEHYVESAIFEPLGMSRTTARQLVPEPLEPDLARSYALVAGAPRPTAFLVDLLGPAGGASSTAVDMAAFMAARAPLVLHGRPR